MLQFLFRDLRHYKSMDVIMLTVIGYMPCIGPMQNFVESLKNEDNIEMVWKTYLP